MKKSIIFLFAISSYLALSAQKKVIDYSVYGNWNGFYNPKISNDGKYAAFPNNDQGGKLMVRATDLHFEKEIFGASNPFFTADNNFLVFNITGDSIGILNLQKKDLKFIEAANEFQLSEETKEPLLAYYSAKNHQLVLKNLYTGEERKKSSVDGYKISDDGKEVIMQIMLRNNNDTAYKIVWWNVQNDKQQTILNSAKKSSGFTFDINKIQITFFSENALVYFKQGMNSAIELVNEKSSDLKKGMIVCSSYQPLKFSLNGSRIFFYIKDSSPTGEIKEDASRVDIWNYKDDYPQEQQLKTLKDGYGNTKLAAVNLDSKKIIQIEKDNDDWTSTKLADGGNYDYALVKTISDWSQDDWRLSARPSIYLVSLKDGSRKIIKEKLSGSYTNHFSPTGKYVIWYDRELKNYFAYNTITQTLKNITNKFPGILYNDEKDEPALPHAYGMDCWLENDKAVLVYDKYDIWQIDPEAHEAPVCITEGYGRKHNIALRDLSINGDYFSANTIDANNRLLLGGFNYTNKNYSFFVKNIIEKGFLEKLSTSAHSYYFNFPNGAGIGVNGSKPIKAKNADVYIVERCSATEYPNFYTTKDFRSFDQLTNLQPQKNYNWLTSELVHWKTFDGKKGEGILYKPENFDPKKKYPIIYHFYEKNSNALNNFLLPEWSGGVMNIPTFVSRGYLVFVPDIYYTIGAPAESAYNFVASAAKHFSKLPWIDVSRMGIQGHSFGGYEVNCIITRTNMFAAAVSAAGLCDMVSAYGTLRHAWGVTALNLIETGQTRIGKTPWEKPDLFIKNSPLFQANKVSTPLLMMSNKLDGQVNWEQGVEFFTALRRLDKRVWMLQYDEGDHQAYRPKDSKDFTMRMDQFFDHYLKGAPAPKWMTQGVPAKLKRIETGFETDETAIKNEK